MKIYSERIKNILVESFTEMFLILVFLLAQFHGLYSNSPHV